MLGIALDLVYLLSSQLPYQYHSNTSLSLLALDPGCGMILKSCLKLTTPDNQATIGNRPSLTVRLMAIGIGSEEPPTQNCNKEFAKHDINNNRAHRLTN